MNKIETARAREIEELRAEQDEQYRIRERNEYHAVRKSIAALAARGRLDLVRQIGDLARDVAALHRRQRRRERIRETVRAVLRAVRFF